MLTFHGHPWEKSEHAEMKKKEKQSLRPLRCPSRSRTGSRDTCLGGHLQLPVPVCGEPQRVATCAYTSATRGFPLSLVIQLAPSEHMPVVLLVLMHGVWSQSPIVTLKTQHTTRNTIVPIRVRTHSIGDISRRHCRCGCWEIGWLVCYRD